MAECIGWPADPPCRVYGRMHGCDQPAGHEDDAPPRSRHRRHVCPCGAIAKTEHYLNLSGTTTYQRRAA